MHARYRDGCHNHLNRPIWTVIATSSGDRIASSGNGGNHCSRALNRGSKRSRAKTRHGILVSAGLIYLCLNVLYFTNTLPPLPLGLKEIGVYHHVERVNGGYYVQTENAPWYESFGNPTLHVVPGDTLYVFSSVFTPVAIKTDIVHRWEYFDGTTKKWRQVSTIRFPVLGGRDGGYRGFSLQPGINAGTWRVSVETPEGRLIGRISFLVVAVPASPPLADLVR